MNFIPAYFVSCGHGHYVNTSKVVTVLRVDTAQASRLKKWAIENDKYLDYTHANATDSYIVLDDGTVIGSAISCSTMCNRFNKWVEDVGFKSGYEESLVRKKERELKIEKLKNS